jgi:hypothetical protein
MHMLVPNISSTLLLTENQSPAEVYTLTWPNSLVPGNLKKHRVHWLMVRNNFFFEKFLKFSQMSTQQKKNHLRILHCGKHLPPMKFHGKVPGDLVVQDGT